MLLTLFLWWISDVKFDSSMNDRVAWIEWQDLRWIAASTLSTDGFYYEGKVGRVLNRKVNILHFFLGLAMFSFCLDLFNLSVGLWTPRAMILLQFSFFFIKRQLGLYFLIDNGNESVLIVLFVLLNFLLLHGIFFNYLEVEKYPRTDVWILDIIWIKYHLSY